MPTATTLTPAQALDRAYDETRSKLDQRLHGSLERACAMVKNGGVSQNEAGQWTAQRERTLSPARSMPPAVARRPSRQSNTCANTASVWAW